MFIRGVTRTRWSLAGTGCGGWENATLEIDDQLLERADRSVERVQIRTVELGQRARDSHDAPVALAQDDASPGRGRVHLHDTGVRGVSCPSHEPSVFKDANGLCH